jgi:hypothetical protein
VVTAPQIANQTGRADKVVAIDTSRRQVRYGLVDAREPGRGFALYDDAGCGASFPGNREISAWSAHTIEQPMSGSRACCSASEDI